MHRITSPNVVLDPGDCARSRLHVLRRESTEEETKGTWIATKAEREGAQSGGILVVTLETP